MRATVEFAYMQARLQAHHGQLPDTSVWVGLEGSGSLGGFLLAARSGPLNPWVLHLGPRMEIHQIERALREQFENYVDEVASWAPQRWRRSLVWIKALLLLPLLDHLRGSEPPPSWLSDDPTLRVFSGPRPIGEEKNQGIWLLLETREELGKAWYREWCRRRPHEPKFNPGLEAVMRAVAANRDFLRSDRFTNSEQPRRWLEKRLRGDFRRYSFQPAAAFAHLGLTAITLERLRGALIRRRLFPEEGEQT